MNKLVIFDLDGTLVDSIHDIEYNINVMLEKYGFKKRATKEIMSFIGNGAKRLVEDSIGEGQDVALYNEALGFYNEIYTKDPNRFTKLFNGVDEMLLSLKKRGYRLCILSNKPQITTDNVYDFFLKKYNFDCVLGQSGLFPKKPDPSSTLFLMNKFNCLSKDTYFIGDGETDVITALNSKVNQISVLWGYREKSQLEAVGANTFVKSPLEIPNLIK